MANAGKKRKLSGTAWRPLQDIRVKVIGICIRDARLLAMEVYDDHGIVKGIRPLGGHVEFGETREQALVREFQEELGTEIKMNGRWKSFENLFEHAGEIGHEYLFAIGITLLDESLYQKDIMVFSEDSGTENRARWFDISDLTSGEVSLFPPALLDWL